MMPRFPSLLLGSSGFRSRFGRRTPRWEQVESRCMLAAEIIWSTDSGLVTLNGSEGTDRGQVAYEGDQVVVSLTSGVVTQRASFATSLVQWIEFNGLNGNDTFRNDTAIPSRADGGLGDDRLTGGSGSDQLVGGLGRDSLHGLAGNDVVEGGAGADVLSGGEGDDQLTGGDSSDVLRGGEGDDQLQGNAGSDTLLGEMGNDSLSGGTERDLLMGGLGRDVLNGDDSGDILIGSPTSYDDSSTSLSSILQIWNSGASYADRVSSITNHPVAPLSLDKTIGDDGVQDRITGGTGSDWYFVPGRFDEKSPGYELSKFASSLDVISPLEQGETVTSLLPHGNDPSRRTEHLAMFELVALRRVTHEVVASGNWTDPAVWRNGVAPTKDANVLVPKGLDLVIDRQLVERLRTVRVDGTLQFSPSVNTSLYVDTLVVTPGGKLVMGTEDSPIARDVTARIVVVDNGAIDRAWDPLELSRGVIIHGEVSIHGTAKTAFGQLRTPARKGDQTLELREAPEHWIVGDRLVLAGTDPGGKQYEELEISSISGKTIGLRQALKYTHMAPNELMSVHVANLTRNAIIESENVADVRGHLMLMHSDSAELNYAGIYNMGRTDKRVAANDTILDDQFSVQAGTGLNQRGRYAMHFHRSGGHDDGHAATVHGSVVTGSRGWGYVNHSSFVEFTSNVSYNVRGAGFVTETGDEIGRFDGNLAMVSQGSGQGVEERDDIEDFGHQGDGFWFQGGGVSVTNNVAVGQSGHGFIFFTRALKEGSMSSVRFSAENLVDPSIAKGQPTISVGEVPLREFRGNEAYANGTGAATRFHKLGNSHEQVSVIEDLLLWNNARGLHLPYTNRVLVRNVRVIGNLQSPTGNGITRNDVTRNIEYQNIVVEGYEVGLQIPQRGEIVVRSGEFNNIVNVLVTTAVKERDVRIMKDVTFAHPANLRGKKAYDVALRADLSPHAESIEHVFLKDRILWHRTDGVRQLYFQEQIPSFVPFPKAGEFIPAEYLGKTNEQLATEFQRRLGGELAPATTLQVANVQGRITPLIGDVNLDGQVNVRDLDELSVNCRNGGQEARRRYDEFLDVYDVVLGDVNFDNVFDLGDLLLLIQRGKFGTTQPAVWSEGDWDCDGLFTFADILIALSRS